MHKKILSFLVLAATALPFQALAQHNDIKHDIPYREGVERCALDISYNAANENVPVIIWFHGGGLTKGNKSIPGGLKGKQCVVAAAGLFCPDIAPEHILSQCWLWTSITLQNMA